MEILKVSSKSAPNAVAGALAGVVRQHGVVELQVVGAGALNQAIKAIAIARSYVSASEIDLICAPTFADIEIDGERRTAIRLLVECRPLGVGDPVAVVTDAGRATNLTLDLGTAEAAEATPVS